MPQTRQEKRVQAEKIAAIRAQRSPTQQLKELDNRPGAAKKERARLTALIEKEKS
jgi:hypothetical protein